MNDINEMPPKCQYCPYWEVCEYPWVCPDREQLATNLQQTCNQLTTDTISRQAAIDAVSNMLRRKFGIGGDLAEITLAGLPSAQPEIIRCKDCKYNTYSKKCLQPDSFFLVPADDFYCGYAERRTDG